MSRSASDVAGVERTAVSGVWERHVAERYAAKALLGSTSGGRWGPANRFPVIYLGRPSTSVIVEAYRHLIDPFDGMTPDHVRPRALVRCEVNVNNVLDLRSAEARARVGLTAADIESDVDDYEACVEVGSRAHQLGCHGVVAPSASRLGETLGLFPDHLPVEELPSVVSITRWERLPPDPRRLRIVRAAEKG